MNVTLIKPGNSAYPAAIEERLADPPPIAAIGNLGLLQRGSLALFCSVKCPGDVILKTYDLIRALRDAGVSMIGGFHSPMEKECLTLLLRGTQPVIVCLARAIDGMRLPAVWKQPLAANRLLILSPFDKKHRRVTAGTSQTRNQFVAALAAQILVAHAGAGSRTEEFCRQLLDWPKPCWTIASNVNENLKKMGIQVLTSENLSEVGRISSDC